MANEEDVGFKVYAVIDGLKESMQQAVASVTKFSTETKEQIESIGGAFEKIQGLVLGFGAAMASGFAFKEMIENTEKWTLSVVSLAKQFGISAEESSGLAVSLRNIGSSTEEYQGAATKLDRQIKSNEENVNALGVTTRDSNGALLSQQQLMLNAISALNEYKQGTDRTVAAQFLFGRGAGDLQHLLLLTQEQMQRGAEDAERFGIAVGGDAYDNTLKFQRATSELNLAMLGIERAVSEAVEPSIESLSESFTSNSKTLETIVTMIKTLETALTGLATIANVVVDAIGNYFGSLAIQTETAFKQIADYAKLNFTQAAKDGKDGADLLAAFRKESLDKMVSDEKEHAEKIAQIWGIGGPSEPKPPASPAASGGQKTVPEGFGKKDEEIKAAEDAAKLKLELAKEEMTTELELSNLALEGKKANLDAEVAAGRITEQQKLQMLQDFAGQEYTLQIASVDKEMQLYDADSLEYQKLLDKKQILTAKYNNDIAKLNAEAAKEQEQKYKELENTISTSMDTMLKGVLQGTQTWKQAMANLFDNLALAFIESQARELVHFVLKQAGMTGAQTTGDALRTASSMTAGEAGLLAHAKAASGSIEMSAGQAAAAVYADVAEIPYVGWLLAPAAAAAAFVAVNAFDSFAVGSWSVPKTGLANIHEGEMIIPASQAQGIRNAAGSANGGGSGGGNVTIHLQAIDTQSGMAFIHSQAETIAAAIAGQSRNSNPSLAGMRF